MFPAPESPNTQNSPFRPILAVTIGDPAGIGPEIILKALQQDEVFRICRPLIIGDQNILRRAAAWVGVKSLRLEIIDTPENGEYESGTIPLLDQRNADPLHVPVGQVGAVAGKAAVDYVFLGCDLAMQGKVDGLVTGPLNKEAMHLGGYDFAGHTELLAERTGCEKVSMLLVGPTLRVIHVSTHVALREAVKRATRRRIEEVIDLGFQACRAFGIKSPRIAVAGLNPHAGEGGLFGNEELTEILPAIEAAKARGLLVDGPVAPDTVFIKASRGNYDIVIAMYHDQGHIPMKLLSFDDGVNVSFGLPIIRTSVDHGTAFDIAGTGTANEQSMLQSIRVAVEMCTAKRDADR